MTNRHFSDNIEIENTLGQEDFGLQYRHMGVMREMISYNIPSGAIMVHGYDASGKWLRGVNFPQKSGTLALTSDIPANQQIGVGQSWQVFSFGGNRVNNVDYTNNTGRPIVWLAHFRDGGMYINGTLMASVSAAGDPQNISLIIPAGSTYKYSGRADRFSSWKELR